MKGVLGAKAPNKRIWLAKFSACCITRHRCITRPMSCVVMVTIFFKYYYRPKKELLTIMSILLFLILGKRKSTDFSVHKQF